MTTATRPLTTVQDKTLDKLQKLIRANLDSSNGFREAADKISDGRVASLFRSLASERDSLAQALKEQVEWNGKDAEEDGSFAAAVHRAWMDVRANLNGGDPYVILAEAEKGEDHIKGAYEDVLKATAGSPIHNLLQSQYVRVTSGHDLVRDLRDQFKQKQ